MLGPTAAGKSEIALRLAEEIGAPILSVDSMQVYRHMDIGTAKPSRQERARVPHHMVDLVEPEETYSVARFQREARAIMEGLPAVVIAGGSGLHFRAVVDPMTFPPEDPELRRELESLVDPAAELRAIDPALPPTFDLANRRRVIRALEIFQLTGRTPSARMASAEAQALTAHRSLLPFTAVGLDPGALLPARIERRLARMRDDGLLAEVASLRGRMGRTAREAVGYRELMDVVLGATDEDEGWVRSLRATADLARKQRTFFRRDPRIRWIEWSPDLEERYRAVREAVTATCGS